MSDPDRSQLCHNRIEPASQSLLTSFTYKGEQRTLSVFFQCDEDHRDRAPQSLSLSMGHNALACELMPKVLHSLSMLGPTLFREDDSGTLPWLRVGTEPLDYLRACQEGLAKPSPFDLRSWLRVADAWVSAGDLSAPTRLLGMSRDQAHVFAEELPYEAACHALNIAVQSRYPEDSSDEGPGTPLGKSDSLDGVPQ